MKKKLFAIFALVILCGCSQSTNTEWKISSDVFLEKMEAKDSFVVVLNQSTNHAGMEFQRTLEPFIREHEDLPIFEVMLDDQGSKKRDAKLALNELVDEIERFDGVLPAMLYIKDGEVTSQRSGALSEIEWRNFLKECGVLKGKVETLENNEIAESERIITDLNELLKAYKDGQDFYLFVAENDKYSIMFSETLKKKMEQSNQSVYLLNLSESKTYESENIQEILLSIYVHMTPSLLHIQDGKVIERLEDNATEAELISWFQ